jgi:hypothetical protein
MTPRQRIAAYHERLANAAAQRGEPTPPDVIVFLATLGLVATRSSWRDARTLANVCAAWAPLRLDTCDVGIVDDGGPLAWSD